MVTTELLVLPAAASPQAHYLAYEELTLLRASLVPAAVWRRCETNLRAAASQLPAPLAARYLNAASVCAANAADMDAVYGAQTVVASSAKMRQWIPVMAVAS
jgi:hypothetical protein